MGGSDTHGWYVDGVCGAVEWHYTILIYENKNCKEAQSQYPYMNDISQRMANETCECINAKICRNAIVSLIARSPDWNLDDVIKNEIGKHQQRVFNNTDGERSLWKSVSDVLNNLLAATKINIPQKKME
ncbi:hypothetical protein HA402_000307 [Bradysia odoriphaga]|nr:hypothetical protein HA402_000307 [Bradysia odoriphaga]